MKRRPLCLALALCGWAFPAIAPAQVQSADLSSLVTLPVAVPSAIADAALRGDLVVFATRASHGFRLVSDVAGRLDLRPGDPLLLPVTVGVGPDLAAGRHNAAMVVYTAPGIVDTVTLELDVAIRRGISVSLASERRAEPGSRLRFRYELTNSGNVADTVTLRLETQLGRVRGGSRTVLLPPFSTRQGNFEVDVAQTAQPGPSLVVIKATGQDMAGVGSLEVMVGRGDDGFLASLVTVPTRLFIGSSARSGTGGNVGSTFGLKAAGDLRPGLRLSVSAHDTQTGTSAFAFRGLQFGPRFRAQLASRSFAAAVGDVVSRTASFAGYRLQGRGGTLEVGRGPVRLFGHAARPLGYAGAVSDGHQLEGGLDIRTPVVVLGFRGLRETRDEELHSPGQETRSAYVRLEAARPSTHFYILEAGWLALKNRSTGVEKKAPAVSARYSYRDGGTTFDLMVRRRPSLPGIGSAGADELRIGGVKELAEGFGLVGQVADVTNPATQLLGVERTKSAQAGVFFRRGADRIQLRGRIRESEGTVSFKEHTVEANAEASVGPGSIDARLEVGSTRGQGLRRSVLRTVAGYNLRGNRGWGRMGLSYGRDARSVGEVSLDLTGAYRLSDAVEIHGSAAAMFGGIADAREALLQAGVQFDLRPDLALLVGAETIRTTGDGTQVQVSVGVRKGLPVPVPFPRQRAVQGVVFLDTDGDGVRGPQEPLMDGVRLTMSGQTVTTRRGHFSFPAGTRRAPIEVGVSSLGDRFMAPAPMGIPGGGEISIPIHQAASLRIEAFFDADRNGLRDPTELPLADLNVKVSTASGGWTLRTAGDGGAELPAIRPGTYSASVDPSTLPRRAQAPGLRTLTLVGGENGLLLLAVPSRSISFLGATGEEPEPAGASAPEQASGGK